MVSGLGADVDRGGDLAPARSELSGLAGELVAGVAGVLERELGFEGAVKQLARITADLRLQALVGRPPTRSKPF